MSLTNWWWKVSRCELMDQCRNSRECKGIDITVLKPKQRTLGLLLLSFLLLVGCSNGALVVKTAYNRVDNQLVKEVNELATFDESQKEIITNTAKKFHLWHRTTQLPRYSNFLTEIANKLDSDESIDENDLIAWTREFDSFLATARGCIPKQDLEPLLQSLTDDQLVEINDHIIETRKLAQQKRIERRSKESAEVRSEKRIAGIEKWINRTGIELTNGQRDILKKRSAQRQKPLIPYRTLADQWFSELDEKLILAKNANTDSIWAHADKYWTLYKDNNPAAYKKNRANFRNITIEFTDSMSSDQKKIAGKWIGKLARSVGSAANDYNKDAMLDFNCTSISG